MTEDVPFYVELAREADGPVVELAVGNGRVAIPVARETGRKVIGIDRSRAMLAQARRTADTAGVDSSSARRTCATSSSRSRRRSSTARSAPCLHLPTWADRRRVFERVAAALQPGGRFAWNVVRLRPADRRRECDGSGTSTPAYGMGWTIRPPTVGSTSRLFESPAEPVSFWWISRGEWEGLIDVAGLEVEALYGEFERTAVHRGQPRVRLGDEEAGMSRQAAANAVLPTRVGSLVPPATQRQRNPRRCTPL